MKPIKYILIGAIIFCSSVQAQDYRPFNLGENKRFECVTDESLDDEFFYAIEADTENGVENLSVFRTRGSEWVEDEPFECQFWGYATHELDTSWLGTNIIFDTSLMILSAQNKLEEPLTFNFSLSLGDTALIYSNDEIFAYMIFSSELEQEVLGETDITRHYEILIENSDGTPSTSLLNGEEIILGQNLGIVSFFAVHSFPESQLLYTLKGQDVPSIGDYMLTYDDIYPWNAGDVIQYRGQSGISGQVVFNTYETMTITERLETVDSVFIYYVSEFIYSGLGITSTNLDDFPEFWTNTLPLPNPIAFKKGHYITNYPIGYVHQSHGTIHTKIYEEPSWCEDGTFLFLLDEHEWYCDSCKCLGGLDGFNSSFPVYIYESTRGIKSKYFNIYGPQEGSTIDYITRIYSDINGITCGDQFVVGLTENQLKSITIQNPVAEQLGLGQFYHEIEQLFIHDSYGRLIAMDRNPTQYIDVSTFDSGLYFLSINGVSSGHTLKWIKQ